MLSFKKITFNDISVIKEYVLLSTLRSCDYTLFGIVLWAEYYSYEFCVFEQTLFIKGENEKEETVFSLPLGKLPPEKSIALVKEYCFANSISPRFYFIPQSGMDFFTDGKIKELENWADYIYAANDLRTLTGHKFNKKRNRLNKFHRLYPDFEYKNLSDIPKEKWFAFFNEYLDKHSKQTEYFDMEVNIFNKALQNFGYFDFKGGILLINNKIAALTIGEIIGDTLFVHIEKALREYEGAYEAINFYFLNSLSEEIKFINREEDLGDEGIRQSKMAYNPIYLLKKYEVTF